MKTEYTEQELQALLAGHTAPITDAMAVAVLKNPIIQNYIAQQIAAADASPPEGQS